MGFVEENWVATGFAKEEQAMLGFVAENKGDCLIGWFGMGCDVIGLVWRCWRLLERWLWFMEREGDTLIPY